MTVMPDMLANGFSASSTIKIHHNQERNLLSDKVVAPLIEAGYGNRFCPLGLLVTFSGRKKFALDLQRTEIVYFS